MKTVLITGSGGGIGKQTSLYFAKNNWTVIATVLHSSEGNDFKDYPSVFCYEMDVTSTESIASATKIISENHPKIDTVINNAGMG